MLQETNHSELLSFEWTDEERRSIKKILRVRVLKLGDDLVGLLEVRGSKEWIRIEKELSQTREMIGFLTLSTPGILELHREYFESVLLENSQAS